MPLGAIVDYIGANLSRRILVDELAAIASLSVFQLTRALRRAHRITPYQLVLAMRIRDAMASLERGASIADSALRAGFSDQSHFTRHFRRHTGMTPKQYAAAPRVQAVAGTGALRDMSARSAMSIAREPAAAGAPS